MAWAAIIAKLKAIEDNLIRQDKYVDRFDAMSLASVVTSERSEDAKNPLNFSPTTQLKGLSKLVNDISVVLHEAYIEQQGALILIKLEIDKCRNFAEFMTSDDEIAKSIKYSPPSSSHFMELGTSSHEHGATSTEKQPSSRATRKRDASKTEAMHRTSRLLKLELHSNLMGILDAKLIAHEVITSSMDIYLKYVVKTAYENGVLDPLRRAKCLVQPQLNILLCHNFLDTSEVCYLDYHP